MTKKVNTKFTKLLKYYSLINYNLIYDNQSINRYKSKDLMAKGSKKEKLKKSYIFQHMNILNNKKKIACSYNEAIKLTNFFSNIQKWKKI